MAPAPAPAPDEVQAAVLGLCRAIRANLPVSDELGAAEASSWPAGNVVDDGEANFADILLPEDPRRLPLARPASHQRVLEVAERLRRVVELVGRSGPEAALLRRLLQELMVSRLFRWSAARPMKIVNFRRFHASPPTVTCFAVSGPLLDDLVESARYGERRGASARTHLAAHSPDFRSVRWYATTYSFTATQAACVQILWAAWENGTPDVGQLYILAEACVDSKRLVDVFRGSPAWGTMIISGQTKGSFRLQEP